MSGVFLITLRSIGEDDRIQGIRDEEMKSLISTLGLEIAGEISFTLKEISVSTYIGKGQAEECLIAIRASEADEVIINAFISPRQEKNLESILGVPISDREAVILSIFFQNARSREARLQIEKAEAEYLRPRLADREARLSQQRGGVRGAKGEGERKIELERRLIDQRRETPCILFRAHRLHQCGKVYDTQRTDGCWRACRKQTVRHTGYHNKSAEAPERTECASLRYGRIHLRSS